MLLVTTWFGSFLVDGKQVADSRLFPKEAKEIARRLRLMERGELLEEEKALAFAHKGFSVADSRLRSLGPVSSDRAPSLDHIASRMGFAPALLHEATLLLGREKLGELGPDRFVVQAIAGLDELTKTSNLLIERLAEWYGLHFPELVESSTQKELVDLVARLGDRETIRSQGGRDLESMGTPLSDDDRRAVMEWAGLARSVLSSQSGLEGYVTRRMEQLSPNLSAVVGPLLAARLLAHTGSIERLGRLPASTMQLLGAEKALFQFMTEGGRPPKHGVLFQHPLVHRAPPWQRGRIARALASAASLAARVDAFGKRDISESIRSGLQRKLERIQKERAAPPDGRRAGSLPPRRARAGNPDRRRSRR
ncbi:MAG: ribosomal biogenesis protein [Euryarchaeota archaeon]|nr:ribosomal biogenesis protein [Euryarchaeota archaeon]